MARLRPGTAEASAPSAPRRLSSAGVGWPEASSPTATGISFCETALSAARPATCVRCAARRRGEAKGVSTEPASARPWATSCSRSTPAKASPSFFSAFGGSSSTNSSTSREVLFMGVVIAQAAFFGAICATHSRGAIGKPSRSRLS